MLGRWTVDEPILLIAAGDAAKLWWEDGSWRDLEEEAAARGLDGWRAGISSVLVAAAFAGIVAVGGSPARWAETPAPPGPAPLPALALAPAVEDEGRIAQLESANRRLYSAIEAAHRKLAEIEVMRAHLEAAATDAAPAVETADARLE
jgi:hypothetical protein